MSDSSKGFSFFLNSTPKEINEKDNPSLEYIVVQNDFLHQKVKDLEEQINELTKEKDQFEEDNERLEKRLVALRGITFNEYEMSKLLEQTMKGYKGTIEEYKKIENFYLRNIIGYYFISILYFILSIFGFFDPIFLLCLMGITIIGNSITLLSKIGSKDEIRLPVLCVNKEKEYHSLRKNQDYIGKMIDNM